MRDRNTGTLANLKKTLSKCGIFSPKNSCSHFSSTCRERDGMRPAKFRLWLALSSNDQYQGNGFRAEVLLGRDHPRVVPIVHRKRSYSISNIGNMILTWLSLLSEFAVVYQISSKLVYAFGLQTPITAEYPVVRCHFNRIMADMSARDGMRPARFRPNWSIARWAIVFWIFSNTAYIRHFEF